MLDKSKTHFEPSMKVLSRILIIMLESRLVGKTSMSQKAYVNYPKIVEHLNWMKRKRLIETVVEEDKVKFKLTEKGMEFAKILSDEDLD